MKKFIYWIFVFGVTLQSFSIFASAQEVLLTQEEKEWIEQNPVLRSGGALNVPPIHYVRQGKSIGFSIDYLRLVTQKVGLEIEFLDAANHGDFVEMLERHELDIMHSLTPSDERMPLMNFSPVYMDVPFVYFGRAGDPRINNLEDLRDKRIGVITGWLTTTIYQDRYPELNLTEYINIASGLNAVSSNEVDVFVAQLPVGNFTLNQFFISGVEVVGRQFFPEEFSGDVLTLGIRNDIPILTDILTKAANSISEQEMVAISQKWLNQYNQVENIGLTQEELSFLQENNSFLVAADAYAAPIEFIDQEGKISGISGDYLNMIADKLNIEFKWLETDTIKEGFESVENGIGEIVSASTPTEEREAFLDFTDPYLTISTFIFARSDQTSFGTLSNMSGFNLAQVSGFSITDYIKENYPDINVIEYKTVEEALIAVNEGEAHAYVGSISSAAAIIAARGLVQVNIIGESEFKAYVSLGIRNDLPLLSSAINKAMQSITENEHNDIQKKWMAMQVDQVNDYTLLIQISVGAIAIIAFVLIWNNRLRREVIKRQKAEEEIQKARQEAEEASRAKSAFLANMSHEIRTPLNAIIGFSEVMSTGTFGKIENQKYNEYLKDIHNSGKHLSTVINDILDLSKIEAGKWVLNEEEFHIHDCIDDALDMFKELATAKNISINCDCENNIENIIIHGDPHSIKRALINLLSNAVKFTPENGKITCKATILDSGDVSIQIIDTGVGIPADRIDHVVNPFDQAHENQYLKEEGTGLGLSIVSNLVHLHDGVFSIESQVGKGTCVTITLPALRIIKT